MKNFIYTTRNIDGSLKQNSLGAADRDTAIAILKSRGIVPLKLEEATPGAKISSRVVSQKKSSNSQRRLQFLVVLTLIVVVAAGLWFYFRSTEHPAPVIETIPPKKEPSVTAPVAKPKQQPPVKPAVIKEEDEAIEVIPPEPANTEQIAVTKPKTAPDNTATNKPRRRPGARILTKDGKEISKPRPEIKTHTDRYLWAMVNSRNSGLIPVSKMHVMADFEKALNTPIEIMPDDTEEDIAAKQNVEELKKDLKKWMDQGNSLEDALDIIQTERAVIYEYRQTAQRTLFSLVKEGKMAEAAEFQQKVNEELAKENVQPLYVPEKLIQIGEENARQPDQ
jgi:type II secretory pathway component PulF